jgi:hypothetical protein
VTYFEGFVNTGDIYTLYDDNNNVAANMDITIYDPQGQTTNSPEIRIPANILQTVNYHSSCSSNLFLADRFGSNQLVEWTGNDVGLVTVFINATLAIILDNPMASGFEIELTELNSFSKFGPFTFLDKTAEVSGVELLEGESFMPPPIMITIDLSVRQRYPFFTWVVGETDDGSVECNGHDLHEFIAGNPLPPTFPTVSPSASPTITPFPSDFPSAMPSSTLVPNPTEVAPSEMPSSYSSAPTNAPSSKPSSKPSSRPSDSPSGLLSTSSSESPSRPTQAPTKSPPPTLGPIADNDCYSAIIDADMDEDRKIDANEYIDFLQLLGPAGFLAGITSFSQLPPSVQINFFTLACMCGQNGGAADCCQGSNAHISNAGAKVGETPTPEQELYILNVCASTKTAINRILSS